MVPDRGGRCKDLRAGCGFVVQVGHGAGSLLCCAGVVMGSAVGSPGVCKAVQVSALCRGR